MKQASRRPFIRFKVIIVAVSLLVLCFVGIAIYAWFLENPMYPSYDPKRPTAAQQKAIDDAVSWRENQVLGCLTVITPAVHPETGARHTFTDSCVAPGWVGER